MNGSLRFQDGKLYDSSAGPDVADLVLVTADILIQPKQRLNPRSQSRKG